MKRLFFVLSLLLATATYVAPLYSAESEISVERKKRTVIEFRVISGFPKPRPKSVNDATNAVNAEYDEDSLVMNFDDIGRIKVLIKNSALETVYYEELNTSHQESLLINLVPFDTDFYTIIVYDQSGNCVSGYFVKQ